MASMPTSTTSDIKTVPIPQVVLQEIEAFEEEAGRVLSGEVSLDLFKPFRLQHGIYGQRQPGVQMVRIKIPFGGLTSNQLRQVGDLADRYATGVGHVTTRQDIQLHYVPLQEVGTIMRKLADVGHPVVVIVLDEPSEIGSQFLWWEIVTVAAASLMKINPFNQPNVAQSKDSTSRLLGGDIVATVTASVPELKEFLSDCVTGEYLAVLAFVEPSERVDAAFTALAAAANRKFGMPMTVGYGPRYLHSSGQLHKGGAKKGRFIQIVDTPSFDVDVPGQPYTFGQLMRAQADGDDQALTERNLPIVRIESIKPLSNILLG